MSGWIKVDKELTETIRFRRLLKAYRHALRGVTERDITCDQTTMLGALIQLWMYADSHISNDNTLAITVDEINEIVGVENFAQCLPADWLHVIDADHVELPDFLEHNGTSARERKNAAKRQANHRWKKKQLDVTRDVTHSNARNDARPDQTRPDQTKLDQKEVPTELVAQDATAVPRGTNNPEVLRVFEHWRTTHNHPKAALDATRKKKICEALKLYSEADICQAITGYLHSPHHMGQNDRNTRYTDLELLIRDAGQIDAGLRFYADPPRTDLSEKTRAGIARTADWEPPETRRAAI